MSVPGGLAIRGFVADGETGAGVGGLHVELWHRNGRLELVGESDSDEAGRFLIGLAPEAAAALEGAAPVPVEVRVHDAGEPLLTETRELSLDQSDVIELTVPLPPVAWEEAEDAELVPQQYEVDGRVTGPAPEDARVEAVVSTLRHGALTERVVAETTVDSASGYRLSYPAPADPVEAVDTSLRIRLYSRDGELIGESAPILSPPGSAQIDVAPIRTFAGPAEYTRLERAVSGALANGVESLDGAEAAIIDELSEWLDVDPDQLTLFREARALESDTGLPAPVFYALGRNGLDVRLPELADVPIHELRTTIEEAAATGIVEANVLDNVESRVEELSARIAERAAQAEQAPAEAGLAEMLAAADIPAETIVEVVRRCQSRSGDLSDFWESFKANGEAESLGEEATRDVERAMQIGEVLGPDPALLRSVHALRREGRWHEPPDLARLTFDDWCELLEGVDPAADATEATEDGPHRALIEARAEAILDALEEQYPSAFICEKCVRSESLSPAARHLIERAPGHDFHAESIRDRTESHPELLEGLDPAEAEAALEEVEAVERISRIADHAEEVEALVAAGIRSASEIACMSARRFGDEFGEALGGRPQAARIHAQAQQTAAGTRLSAIRLLQAIQHVPFVIGAPRPDIKGAPDARTLFQIAGGFCDCEHCGSVYSPAAYFVELLRYLDLSTPERIGTAKPAKAPASAVAKLGASRPLDVLLGRRPDLADVPLTCENTLTALPYIDLVNELLEARITGGSAAFDTGKTPADVLRAVPQNISREAYLKLQEAVHPIRLPYHQPLAVARAYLGHLGVSRLDLIRAFGRGATARDAEIAESLGMSPEEFAAITKSPPDLWRHFGFAADPEGGLVESLTHVPKLLEATEITFKNLIDLVGTRFVGADDQLHLDTPSADCDPNEVRIAGLDATRLSRLLRLIRLQRRIGWSYSVLDRALVAFGATELDAPVLEKLATARDVATRLDRPVAELLVLWAPLDARGKDSEFDRLFTTRAVMWRTQDARTFQLRPDRLELAETADSLDTVASALLAAFRITSEELELIRALVARRGAAPRLDLAGLSAIQRVVVLARATQLRIGALDLLLRLMPPEADPFRPGDPAATRRFVDIVREVQASDFTPERLAYVFRHESDPRRDPAPLPAQVESVLATMRRGLADAFAETSRPADVTGETLRQKLALLLDPTLVDAAIEALDPRTTQSAEARREVFDRHLARIFADPAAAATRLFPPAAAPPAREELEQRWRANIQFILDHLLPQLRTRLLRGSVVQTLSDTLGLSVPATARLLDVVLRSQHRRGEPLLGDFLALLGTGLTGAYFANPELKGEPAITRTDPELTFSWGGAVPAAGVPGREFSVRWSGRFAPRSKSPHTFYVQTDGAVRLLLIVGGAERVLIDRPAASGRVAEHASQPIALDPRELVEMRLEYRNQGAPAAMSLQFGAGPGAKQPVPTANLYPVDGLTSFAPVERSYRRLHKAALLVTGFGMTDAQLEWLTSEPPFLNLDALPMQPGADADASALFQRWRQLAGLFALRKKLPRSNVDVFEVFRADTMPEAINRLVLATGWDRSVVEAFIGPDGFAFDGPTALRPAIDQRDDPALLRLARAVDMQRRVGVAPATLHAWANAVPDADGAAAIVQAVKARYDEPRWLDVARTLNDPLRADRRDALVAYLLPRMREHGVTTRNQFFEYFLIDVEMSPCMLTSRIRQAIAAVQTFFQRCLMNLEPKVPPRVIGEQDWKWLKNYRVWEANRKIFLYPENWIEPELRDDKSPLFEMLERTILQQEIKNDNVEAAFADYLAGLDEISRLDVRAAWFEERPRHRMAPSAPMVKALRLPSAPWSEWDQGTYHIFARTFNAPHEWYYRRLENGRHWTPWEKIEAEIEGEHLVPIVFHRRMHLFWTLFREVNKPAPPQNRESKGSPPALGKDWEIQLAYTVYDRGRWTRKRLSSRGVVDVGAFVTRRIDKDSPQLVVEDIDGTQLLSPSDYILRAAASEQGETSKLQLYLFSRSVLGVADRKLTLSPDRVDAVARFDLDGCSGALVPNHDRNERDQLPATVKAVGRLARRGRVVKSARPPRRMGRARVSGGSVNVPPGYRIDGTGFARAAGHAGSLLALQTADARGIAVALPQVRDAGRPPRIIPVVNPKQPDQRGLYPFFFQDRFRSYFVRPIFADWKPPVAVAVPLLARRAALRAPALRLPRRAVPVLAAKNAVRGRGRREEIEELSALAPEAIDAWEDQQDEAWHPDDSAEARPPRQRTNAPAAAARPAPAAPAARPAAAARQPARAGAIRGAALSRRPFALARREMFRERRLQFTPFEHPDVCRFISTLRAKGIEGLLDFATTRPAKGRDHVLQRDGTWARTPLSWFQRYYGAGPLVFTRNPPHLDVGFESANPYGAYNWELFFHAPLQVAVRLAKDGRHEEAQRWFHLIFDPTTDSSAPIPKRYWKFAPFYENNEYENARALMHLLSYTGKDPVLVRRNTQVREQLAAWWEKPFSPHVIARLRIVAYQKAVVMKYIDNLVEWGDKLFRRDTMESIQEATQIYILAATILGPRPEKIPQIVTKEPLTFGRMRKELNPFSNFEVRLENLQVRRPFRINARPDTAGARAALSMITQYFCTPPNPQLDKYWDTVADRLFKIRNCMNIQGIVRQLPLFDPPIDPGLLVRAAAAGVDLGSVIASLNAPPPHYRFRFLLARAIRLAEEIRSFGAMTLRVLERRDAEALASLRASNETALLDAVRDIRKKQVRQVEEALAELNLQREEIDMHVQHINTQLQQLMNPQEQAAQKSLTAVQVYEDVAEGVQLVSKVMSAIPEFQAGTAGGFSSPFVTLQLGGQMLGKIASAFAASIENIAARHQNDAEMAAAQAEYQRRREEWQNELDLLGKEKAQIEKRIAEGQLKLEITSAELRRHDLEVDNAKKIEAYLRDKYTNQQLYGWMLGQLSGVYFQAYKVAFDAAQQAERAFRFERGDQSSSFIEFSYWDSLKNGLFAGERLLLDLRRMEGAHVEGDRRLLEVTRHISLRQDFPLAFMELLGSGRCQIAVTEALLDGDFPGHYFRRVKTVSMTASGPLKPHSNVNCTLTLLENRIRTDANASGSYAQSGDADDPRFVINAVPIQAVATSRPDADAGVFHLRFDDERYLPFEGAGAISNWRIELQQADNSIDVSQLIDVVISLSYTARYGGGALEAVARADREKGLARGGIKPEALHLISLRRDVPAAWKRLEETPAGQEVEAPLPLNVDTLPGRYRETDVRTERVTIFAPARGTLAADALRLRLDPPKGSGTPVTGWAPPWPRSRTLRATAEASGAPGTWKLAVSATGGKVPDVVDDLVFVFELRARKT